MQALLTSLNVSADTYPGISETYLYSYCIPQKQGRFDVFFFTGTTATEKF